MNIKNSIEIKLLTLQPRFLDVINESHKHNVPEGSESHFKVTIVSDEFIGKTPLTRHRMVNSILTEELNSIHALVMHIMTTEEWIEKGGKSNESPPCLGGSRIK